MIKCYDTISKKYIDVEVNAEVETFIKRSYWREDIQERRYYARVICYEDYYISQSDVSRERDSIVNSLAREETLECIKVCISKLKRKHADVIEEVYYEGKSLTKIAEERHVSVSYISKLLKQAREQLKIYLVSMNLDNEI